MLTDAPLSTRSEELECHLERTRAPRVSRFGRLLNLTKIFTPILQDASAPAPAPGPAVAVAGARRLHQVEFKKLYIPVRANAFSPQITGESASKMQ